MSTDAFNRWLELAAQYPVGEKPQPIGLRRNDIEGVVAVGQLRRVEWGDHAAMVLVTAVDEEQALVSVWPTTLESGAEDVEAVVIEEAASPLYSSITLWPTKGASLSFVVLDREVGSIPKSLIRAVAGGDPPIDGIRPGTPAALGSGGAEAVDELFDTMDVLSTAPKYETIEPKAARKKLAVSLPDLIAWLNVSQADGMSILIGKQPLSIEQASVVAEAAGIPVDEVMASVLPLPDDLNRELQEPLWRDAIRARSDGTNESVGRLRLGYEAFALAARQGPGEGRDKWRQRIRAVIVKGY